MFDVTVVGSIVVDLISYVENFPKVGETVIGNRFAKGFGGKGANQCVMSKILGAETAMIGKVGNDVFGLDYLERFKSLGINTDNIVVSPSSSTGVASITVRPDGANQIVITPGANFDVIPSDVERCSEIIAKSKVVLCQMEIVRESSYMALKIAKDHDVLTIFNPAPIPINGLILSDMPPVDIFCPNETEASSITNIPINDVESAFLAIKFFFNHFSHKIKYPMVTLGRLGVVFGDSESGSMFHEPAPVVEAVDTTGAGDCFAGSLAYFCAIHPNLSLTEKVRKAIQLASLSVQNPGTQSSFPDMATAHSIF